MVCTDSGIESRLVNLDRDLLMIPNVAIHMNRKANDGYTYNPAVDMIPLMGSMDTKDDFLALVAQAAGCQPAGDSGQRPVPVQPPKGHRLGRQIRISVRTGAG